MVGGDCRVHAYLHTHFVATCNSVINLILVVTFGSAVLVKVDAFVKTLTVSTRKQMPSSRQQYGSKRSSRLLLLILLVMTP